MYEYIFDNERLAHTFYTYSWFNFARYTPGLLYCFADLQIFLSKQFCSFLTVHSTVDGYVGFQLLHSEAKFIDPDRGI
jgi:hypothetical protein